MRLVTGFTRSQATAAAKGAAKQAGDDYGAPGEPDWRGIDWRSRLRDMEIRGSRVHYVDIGEGEAPPVILVHGWGGSWQCWLENLPHVAMDRRTIAVDLPGFGQSEMPRDEFTISTLAEAVHELCERLELGPVALIGNSMGGFVSADMTILFPEQVERLMLVSAAGISQNELRRTPTRAAVSLLALGSALTAARSEGAVRRPGLRHPVMSALFRHPSRIPLDLVFEQHAVGNPLTEGFVAGLDALTSYDFRERLTEIGCPVLVVHGTDDLIVPVEDADEYERLIPDARKMLLEDTGHLPMMERPPTFNRILTEFLAEMGEAEDKPSETAAA